MFFRICVSVCIGVGIVLWIVFFVPQTKDNTVSVPSISIDNTSETPQKIIADWLVRVMRTDNYQNWNLYPTELETYNWLHVYKGRIDNISWSWVVIDDIFFSTTRSKNINFSALFSGCLRSESFTKFEVMFYFFKKIIAPLSFKNLA